MTNEERRQMRMQQMEQFLASGMNVTQWMKLNHMSSSTFYLWFNKFREEDPQKFGVKNVASQEWIEIERAQMKDDVAVVKANSTLRSQLTLKNNEVPFATSSSTQAIKITTSNNVVVEIPVVDSSTIGAVLQAVMQA